MPYEKAIGEKMNSTKLPPISILAQTLPQTVQQREPVYTVVIPHYVAQHPQHQVYSPTSPSTNIHPYHQPVMYHPYPPEFQLPPHQPMSYTIVPPPLFPHGHNSNTMANIALTIPRARTRAKRYINLKCERCGTTDTPEWRKGPNGARTLCNACGLFHAKVLKKEGAEAAALAVVNTEVRKRRRRRSYAAKRQYYSPMMMRDGIHG